MAKLKISSPWVTYYNELRELFNGDESVRIVYDEENNKIDVYVAEQVKATALERFLPTVKEFGNVSLVINVIPPNETKLFKTSSVPSIRDVFKGNPHVDDIIEIEGMFSATYVVFHKEVVQYFDDNLGDINGNISTLYQNIASNVFVEHTGIFFCTNTQVQTYHSYVTSNSYVCTVGDTISFNR